MGISGVFFGKMFYHCFTLVFYLTEKVKRKTGYNAGRVMTHNPSEVEQKKGKI